MMALYANVFLYSKYKHCEQVLKHLHIPTGPKTLAIVFVAQCKLHI